MRSVFGKRRLRGIFITGTDTGVGKTYVACGIVRELRSRGIDTGVMKPAETGCRVRQGTAVPSDAMALVRAAGVKDPLSLVNPYRFRKPLAPSVAAGLEGATILPGRIRNAFGALCKRHDYLVVEGSGGIMVPLTRAYLFLDLAASFGLPVLVVARPGLGTINHTLLTVEALKRKRLPVAGIVFNHAEPSRPGLADRTGPPFIGRHSGVPVLGTVRHGGEDFGSLCDFLAKK